LPVRGPVNRRRDHDPPVALQDHLRQAGRHREEGALEVDRVHPVPVRLAHVGDAHFGVDAGVLAQHVDVAEALDGGVRHDLGIGRGADVDAHGPGRITGAGKVLRRRPGGVLVDVGDQDLGALGREHLRGRPADALARPGDDACLALQPVSYAPSSAIDAP
jgi:hypothetical protein